MFGRGRASVPKYLPQAYFQSIGISIPKNADLLRLCRQHIIPEELHHCYESLPTSHQTTGHVPEPGVEESGSDDD